MDNNEAHEHTINLQTKLTEAQALIDQYRDAAAKAISEAQKAQAEIDRLKAERDRLREALNSIANDDMAVCDSCDAYQETARAALERKEAKDGR